MNQANRLMSGSSGSRVSRVRETAFRYYDNIRSRGNFRYRDSDYNVKYTRGQYMGNSNG